MGCSESQHEQQCPIATFKARPSRSVDWWETRLKSDAVTNPSKSFTEDLHSPLTKEQKKLVRESWRQMAPRATEIGKQVYYLFAVYARINQNIGVCIVKESRKLDKKKGAKVRVNKR